MPVHADKTSPLEWWKEHAEKFPILSQLARIVLAVPGSQIECERVFSLAGLLTKKLRSKMRAERLDHMVFLGKNMDVAVELERCLAPQYGVQIYEQAATNFKPLSETQLAEAIIAPNDDGEVDFDYVTKLPEDSEPSAYHFESERDSSFVWQYLCKQACKWLQFKCYCTREMHMVAICCIA